MAADSCQYLHAFHSAIPMLRIMMTHPVLIIVKYILRVTSRWIPSIDNVYCISVSVTPENICIRLKRGRREKERGERRRGRERGGRGGRGERGRGREGEKSITGLIIPIIQSNITSIFHHVKTGL